MFPTGQYLTRAAQIAQSEQLIGRLQDITGYNASAKITATVFEGEV